MPINATLERLVIATPQAQAMADFYARAFAYVAHDDGGDWRCEGPERSLWLRAGPVNQLLESHFLLRDASALDALASRLRATGTDLAQHDAGPTPVVSVRDPDGRRLCFGVRSANTRHAHSALVARLQHYALRSPAPQALARFYIDRLGFTASDWVRDAHGEVTAVFLRTDVEHHVLAIFRAPECRFDHFACETTDWNSLRDWADHTSRQGALLAWGVGRHGPGNDTFFMVKDPDGNMAEISAELEQCDDDRPAGEWPHSPQTLNLWGQAIMRS